ncbi:uncharacterized protein LOC135690932 [Rhopilema esculentum]|uniref:uncharacterized protein LOC135690932 n=1 Tax=Rhopilema esculentum TaxID=499914 RepID=UPI0031E1030C
MTYMSPKQPTCSRFYILPKIHKDRNNPPGRPIVSANGHHTEHISEYVSDILNPLVPKLPSCIKDTTHFLNKLCSISAIPNDFLLVTLDVSSLYTNIPHTEGIKAARGHLNKRTLKTPPTETVCDLIDIILTNNNFEFNRQHFLQKQGTAMGTRIAPPYANLFMGTFESDDLDKSLVWWLFIVGIFMIWTHGQDKLTDFINALNSTHPTIKFTSEQSKQSIHLLDVTISINKNNTLFTDLYVKPTDTHQYLLSTSAHPKHTKQSIPYSFALRLRRICSEDETYKFQTKQLLQYLTKRGYKRKQTRKQMRKASRKTRQDCLKPTKQRKNDRTPFVVTYHPSLPQLSTILKQNINISQNYKTCKEVFSDVLILSYRRPKNLRNILVRARIKSDTPSNLRGTHKCHSRRNCITCQRITDSTTSFNFTNTDSNYDIKKRLDCNSNNVLYALQCKCCLTNGHKNCQYIGQTSRRLKDRFNEHRRDIINKKVDKSGVAEDFCSPEHTINDLTVTPLLKLNDKLESVRRAKEQYLIGLANTLTSNGMNRTTDR